MKMEEKKFQMSRKREIERMARDKRLKMISERWFLESCKYKYSYNFSWLGRPIIQYPQDMVAMQEIIWKVNPDLIIETGIAHGGSIIFYASILDLLGGNGQVLGIDIDIRRHNRIKIERHPMFKRIKMMEGDSIDKHVMDAVYRFARWKERVILVLDSNHTHAHVFKELTMYSPLVKRDSYIVVFDTVIENMPDKYFSNRPWKKGNSPNTAICDFLKTNNRFRVDREIQSKLLVTVAPDGYLKCIKD